MAISLYELPGIRACLNVPVSVAGAPVGVLDLYAQAPRLWDDSQIVTANTYAGVLSAPVWRCWQPPTRCREGIGMELAFNNGVLRIFRTHQPPGLRVEGEVDQANTPALAKVLTGLTQAGQDVHVDLAGLEFIDVEGLRLLVDVAAQLPDDHSLVLDAMPGHLRRVLQLAGWDATPGLVIGSGRQ